MKAFLSKYVAPILWRYVKGSKRYDLYASYRKNQWASLGENLEKQRGKLFRMVEYSMKHIPYYARVAKERNISISERTIFEDIRKFPILTKEVIRKEGNSLRSSRISAVMNTSGGTTGEPVTFYQDASSRDAGAAIKMLFNEWAGRTDGEYMMNLWGSERDILEGGDGFRGMMVRYFTNTEMLNSFRMSNEQMDSFIRKIRINHPKLLLSYVQSAYELAKYAHGKGISIPGSEAVMTSAGNLYPSFRSLIEEIFECPVFNRYGSREVGDMACDCEQHNGLHLDVFNHYIEILDEKGYTVGPDAIGQVFVTTLSNYAMPLIRYRIGDMASGVDFLTTCDCGRGFPLVRTLAGRDVGLFYLEDGTAIDGEFFTHLFYGKEWVRKFQVVQEDYHIIRVNIVLNDQENAGEKDEIFSGIRAVMGAGCDIRWEVLDDIPASKSGKFLFTYSLIKK